MDYLKQLQYIAHVDKNDTILGPVERWEAHEKGILHRAFTLTIQYQDQLLLQHRRHPVFDGIYDVTISSHPLFIENTLEDPMNAVYRTLYREWGIKKQNLAIQPTYKGKLYYQAHDPRSKYQEHEICHIYACKVKNLSIPSLDAAYGFSLQTIEQLGNKNNPLYSLLAPWVQAMQKENLL